MVHDCILLCDYWTPPSELSVCVPKASESEKILPPNAHFKSAKA